jgi:hypothetical protein
MVGRVFPLTSTKMPMTTIWIIILLECTQSRGKWLAVASGLQHVELLHTVQPAAVEDTAKASSLICRHLKMEKWNLLQKNPKRKNLSECETLE